MTGDPTNGEATTSEVLQLLRDYGESDYIGESISQLQHCLQCAQLASLAGSDNETIIAALLHDIGQFLPIGQANEIAGQAMKTMDDQTGPQRSTFSMSSNSVGRVGHETIGARFLETRNFSPRICSLVGSHVAAKRYLCAVDSSYYDKLSDASKKSLEMQGGPMSHEEVTMWRESGLAEDMCRLRQWDDAAKVEGLAVPELNTWRSLIQDHLISRESRITAN